MNTNISFQDIQQAHQIISKFAHRTPVLTCSAINKITHTNLFFKCENFQKVGAFKFRGAINAISNISKKELKKGVATHSSGNHAAALALAAKLMNVPAYIVMPETAPEIKKKAVAGYGAKITFCKPTLEARELELQKIVNKTEANFIHPYDNDFIIAGQATAAKELIENYGDFDIIMAPVGGGGLLSGTSISTKNLLPKAKIIAGEPEEADDAYRSFCGKKLYPSVSPTTIADGLLTSLSERTFKIISENVSEIITVPEKLIIAAMKTVWERMKIIIEPSSAVPLAAILKQPDKFENKKIGIIISGGNVDLSKLPW